MEENFINEFLPFTCTQRIMKINRRKFCKCGCGRRTTWRKRRKAWNEYIIGHANKGKSYIEIYGKQRAKEESLKRKEGNKGKFISEDTKAKIREYRKNKTYEEIYGKDKAKELKLKASKRMKNNKLSEGKHWEVNEEGRKNMSQARQTLLNDHKRRKKYSCRLSSALRGKPKSEATKKKLSLICSDGRRAGINNNNWHGGVSFLPYSVEWNQSIKMKIMVRDNCVCQICGKVKKQSLENKWGWAIHHIDYNKQNCSESNLILLCSQCHNKTSQIKNREKWILILQNKIKEKEVIAL